MIKDPIHKPTVKMILNQVKAFDASVIKEGKNDTEEDKLINMYADGVVQGYKDAVKQISEFLEDLLQ